MTDEIISDCCPYCSTRQIGTADADDFYRCHGCNFFVRQDWLVPEGEQYILNDAQAVLCPWCGYPSGTVQDLKDDDESICDGCSGTISAGMLVTQAALVVDRSRGSRERNLILVVMIGVFVLMLVIGAFMAI